jgi:hypothetical protein
MDTLMVVISSITPCTVNLSCPDVLKFCAVKSAQKISVFALLDTEAFNRFIFLSLFAGGRTISMIDDGSTGVGSFINTCIFVYLIGFEFIGSLKAKPAISLI